MIGWLRFRLWLKTFLKGDSISNLDSLERKPVVHQPRAPTKQLEPLALKPHLLLISFQLLALRLGDDPVKGVFVMHR